jgi:transcriptional regulator with XRE-family HTH domain
MTPAGGSGPSVKVIGETKQLRREAGAWLKELRGKAGLSQMELAEKLGLKYYTFISQVENGFGRVPTESMERWAQSLGVHPTEFAKHLLVYYEPELYRLLFEVKS